MPAIREEIRSLEEYRLTQHRYEIKLNQNENPFELPEEIKREILERFQKATWSRYPAFVPSDLIARVAAFAGWKPEGTLVGNGSNELLQILFFAVLEKRRTVVISQPTFTLYKILARATGADIIEVPMLSEFRFDVERIIGQANRFGADMVVLCSPNNPTGTHLSEADVARIVGSTKGLVVLDEAYVHFSPGSSVRLLAESERLVVLQTFSKAMGAASLRFGYLLGTPAITRDLGKIKLPYNVNAFTLIAAEVFIERWERIRTMVARIMEERERVRARMRDIPGIVVYPSAANFLLFETIAKTPGEVFQGVLKKGILIRDVSSYPQLGRGLRVTIGTPDENNSFLAALQEVMG